MATLVVSEAIIMCAAGSAPSALTVIGTAIAGEGIIGTISSAIPFLNVESFATCSILSAETLGADTTCVPATEAWVPGVPTVLIGGECALDQTSILMCDIGGVITVEFPGQLQVIAAG